MSHPKRAIVVGLALLLALLLQSAPASVAVPARPSIVGQPVELILSAAPAAGTVVELSLPADRFHDVPLIERPGQPHMLRAGIGGE